MPPKSKKQRHFKNEQYLAALGEHCRKLRVKRGYSVNRLAADSEGLSPSVILRLEKGTGAVTVSALLRYADTLEIHPKKLLDFDFDVNF